MPERNFTDLVDWTDLQFLVELARHGSLSAAARALNVTHATVARRVGTLNESFGQPMFRRQAGHYVPTKIGAHIVALALEMEEPALRVARAMAGVMPEIAGPVRITTTDPVASQLIAPLLPELCAEHPGLDIELLTSSDNLSLARREADIAVRMARPHHGDLFARKLSDMAYYRYASRKYLRARRPSDYRYIGYCGVSPDRPEVVTLEKFCTPDQIAIRTNQMSVRLSAVEQEIGIGLLPKLVAEPGRGLERLDRTPALVRELWVLVHRDLRDTPRIRVCIERLVNSTRQWRRRLV